MPLLRNYFGLSFRASFNCCQKLQYSSSKVNGTSLGRALVNVTDLPQLSVRANGIKVVNEETLPWEFRRNVTWIDLAQNPFNCTCELLWFRRSVFWRTSDGCWCRFYGLCFKNGFRRIIIRLAVWVKEKEVYTMPKLNWTSHISLSVSVCLSVCLSGCTSVSTHH